MPVIRPVERKPTEAVKRSAAEQAEVGFISTGRIAGSRPRSAGQVLSTRPYSEVTMEISRASGRSVDLAVD